MKFFRSKAQPRFDPHLPALTTVQADHLRSLVGQYHAGRPQVTIGGDAVHAPQGVSPLHNLAELCRRADPREWPRLVEHHFRAVEGAEAATPQGSEQVLRVAYLRLLADDAFPAEVADGFRYVRPVAPGLQEALALDLPEAVRLLDDRAVGETGLEALRAAGRANLVREPVEYDVAHGQGGATLHIASGASMFVASKALVLDELARAVTGRELPADGALFTAPSRHYLAFHPLAGREAVDALNDLAAFGLGAYQDNPGPVSPRVYWWHRGTVTSLTRIDEETRSFSIAPPEELMVILRRLHAGA